MRTRNEYSRIYDAVQNSFVFVFDEYEHKFLYSHSHMRIFDEYLAQLSDSYSTNIRSDTNTDLFDE
jgi:hypothetical protein